MRAELEKDIAKWKKAFLDESNELAKRSTELNDLHDAYAILAEKYEAAIAAQAQQPTDLSKQLREYAADSGYSHNDYADTMLAAAAAIERLTASQAQQPCTTCGGSGYSPPSTDSFLCQACSGKGYPPAPEGGDKS